MRVLALVAVVVLAAAAAAPRPAAAQVPAGAPTLSPTASDSGITPPPTFGVPTRSPTAAAPTEPMPTLSPTQPPSSLPTSPPTNATLAPSLAPTQAPTQAPVNTSAPTSAPTDAPTHAPTFPLPETGASVNPGFLFLSELGAACELTATTGQDLSGAQLHYYTVAGTMLASTTLPPGSVVADQNGNGWGTLLSPYPAAVAAVAAAGQGVAVGFDAGLGLTFLSYGNGGAPVVATDGPLRGNSSTAIGLDLPADLRSANFSLQVTGVWPSPVQWMSNLRSSYGRINANLTLQAPPTAPPSNTTTTPMPATTPAGPPVNPSGSASIFVNELFWDAAASTPALKVELGGPAGSDLTGWSVSVTGADGTSSPPVAVAAGPAAILPNSTRPLASGFGVIVVSLPLAAGALFASLQAGTAGIVLASSNGSLVQFLSLNSQNITATDPASPAFGFTSMPLAATLGSTGAAATVSLQLTMGGVTFSQFTLTTASPSLGQVNNDQTPYRAPARLAPVTVNELHYQNAGSDRDEEVELLIDTTRVASLTGWSLVFYNRDPAVVVATRALGDLTRLDQIPGWQIVTFKQPGLHDLSQGLAVVDSHGALVSFVSYGGVVFPTDGPAAGYRSVDIGVQETASTLASTSLQRIGRLYNFTWIGGEQNSFGEINFNQVLPPASTVAPTSTVGPTTTDLAVACAWDWTEWSPCNASCGWGNRTREVIIISPPQGAGTPCPANNTMQYDTCIISSCAPTTSPTRTPTALPTTAVPTMAPIAAITPPPTIGPTTPAPTTNGSAPTAQPTQMPALAPTAAPTTPAPTDARPSTNRTMTRSGNSSGTFLNELLYSAASGVLQVEVGAPAFVGLGGWYVVAYAAQGVDASTGITLAAPVGMANISALVMVNESSSATGFGVVVLTLSLTPGSPAPVAVALVDPTSAVVQLLSVGDAASTVFVAEGMAAGLTSVPMGATWSPPASLQLIGGGLVATDFEWTQKQQPSFGLVNANEYPLQRPARLSPLFINEVVMAGRYASIEVAAPAGTNLAPLQAVFYNSIQAQPVASAPLSFSGTVPDLSGDGWGVSALVSKDLAATSNAVALVDTTPGAPANGVVQFITWGRGAFLALRGPANDLYATNIGDWSSLPAANSMQLNGTGIMGGDFLWTVGRSSFNKINANQEFAMTTTAAPTMMPTGMPTGTPTNAPTGMPTTPPTGAPTLAPTMMPTARPSEPPGTPTTSPTTAAPTNMPSNAPTVPPGTPTTSPTTAAPTMVPTAAPVATTTTGPIVTTTAGPIVTSTTGPATTTTTGPATTTTTAPATTTASAGAVTTTPGATGTTAAGTTTTAAPPATTSTAPLTTTTTPRAATTTTTAAPTSAPTVAGTPVSMAWDADYDTIITSAAMKNAFESQLTAFLASKLGVPSSRLVGLKASRGSIVTSVTVADAAGAGAAATSTVVSDLRSKVEAGSLQFPFGGTTINVDSSSFVDTTNPAPRSGGGSSGLSGGAIAGIVICVLVLLVAVVAFVVYRTRSGGAPIQRASTSETFDNPLFTDMESDSMDSKPIPLSSSQSGDAGIAFSDYELQEATA